jgi:hypothetical protein
MANCQAGSFHCAVLARLAEDLRSRNVVYAMIGGAAVWLLSDGEGREIKDIDILVRSECDVRELKAELSRSTDNWYADTDVHFFAGLSWSDAAGIKHLRR